MAFTAINTQEEFDAAIKARLEREREKFKDHLSPEQVEEKYRGFLSPDEVSKKYEGFMSKEDVEKKYQGYVSPDEIKEKDAKLKQYETDSVKTKMALKYGIPYELAGRLTGDDESSIEKDAESFAKMVKTQRGAPLRSNETEPSDGSNEGLISMLNQMKGE